MNVLNYFENTVSKYPNKIALVDNENEYTYSQVMDKAKKIATVIKYQNKKPILIICNREVSSIISFWGTIYSGNFYVPLDENIPLKRLKAIVENTNPNTMILMKNNATIEEYCLAKNIQIIFWDKNLDNIEIDDTFINNIKETMLDIDPLYMVYTSGSTGTPKGVIKSQGSMINFFQSFQQTFSLNQDDIFGNQASFDFDVAAKDIFLSVFLGAKLVIIPKKCFLMPIELIKFLNKFEITILIWAAAAIRFVANSKVLFKKKPEYLRKVFFSGEVIQIKELQQWITNLDGIEFVNLYAPTEVTGNCMYFSIKELDDRYSKLPLGRTFSNIDVMILNENNLPICENEHGEIYIRGSFLAKGYYNDFEKTIENFVQNPLHNNYPDIVYKTGDIATALNGEYYYVGRADNQIKHMGYRIELEEIEQMVYTGFDKIQRCCALYDKDKNIIVLVIQKFSEEEINVRDILSTTLPKYMLPSKYLWIEKIPENSRGKLDRIATLNYYKGYGEI
ncbi:AMP-binding protein [Lysinibacillus sp. FSL H8-0500]|uniref:AMP-dependent synthetase/ligase domain-containing protein n=1 Tax=Lysinibacillus macroides TaxID=33935 RepID=A0A0M9DKN8_9BACI|nr:AMP-binding protein [Lysinibacillus macroides]KOY82370.1 hypothetical protein ADM90_03225 [Lysinibacillus macroides]QPR66589.1 AMP-binding protein [Lysinibacillus macroides]